MARRGYSLHKGYGIFLVPGVLFFLVLVILPFLASVGSSFTRWTGIGTPIWVGLANYQRALGDAVFWASFRNIFSLIIGMTVIPTIIGLLLAVVLFDYIAKRHGNAVANFFRGGFFLPQVFPVVIAAIVWRWIYQPEWGAINQALLALGLGDLRQNWLGDPSTALYSIIVMLIWFQIGYPLVIFMAGLQRVNPEIYEAAAIDGVSSLQKLLYITVPMIRPEIYVVVLTTMIYALKTFGPIYAMTRGGPGSATMVPSYFAYRHFFETSNVGYGATMATVLTLLIMVITVVYIRMQSSQDPEEGL